MNAAVPEEAYQWLMQVDERSGPARSQVFLDRAVAWLGQTRLRKPFAPTNATRHWLWGDKESFSSLEPSLRHTAVGYATHHASALMWALFYERWLARERERILAGSSRVQH